jgi:amidase
MHGIPVLLKDNIATGDHLQTAAGAAAMLGWDPDRDAFLVRRLRDAGAVILGKANLSEWANYMDSCMPDGFSTNGGQTRNPYGPFDTLGSSSGSAVAVAADLTTVSVGSETQGSIIKPATINSVVALKTSRGLVSRDYILPLLPWQDVPGPIGRTVTDVAALLSAMVGVDENDPETAAAAELSGTDFAQFLSPRSGRDRRLSRTPARRGPGRSGAGARGHSRCRARMCRAGELWHSHLSTPEGPGRHLGPKRPLLAAQHEPALNKGDGRRV